MIKYLGSKRLLVPRIVARVDAIARTAERRGRPIATVLDPFSGTARVAHALKARGFRVHASDHNAYAATLAACYVQADRRRWLAEATRLIAELDALPGRAGWFTETFCVRARYLRPENGARVDAIRERIARLALDPELEAIALTSLMEAADRVDSTVGVQMAYLKRWAPRAHQPLTLRVPALLDGAGAASRLDAREAVERITADLVYLDPPYNQHSYLGNYHVWESLVRWDKPAVYGLAMKRVDVRERWSPFNRRGTIAAALGDVIARARARWLVVSFSDEGYLTPAAVRAMLAGRGRVRMAAIPHPRYVGAAIGIYNPRGEKVGTPGHRMNRECLFVVEVADGAPARRAAPRATTSARPARLALARAPR
ncbi:MAG: DNA adenine methylase [Candidatus Eisenbacteria bacterium]|nr:DNA adenine methylase [Candidatus Eisenbacteria bacterium]